MSVYTSQSFLFDSASSQYGTAGNVLGFEYTQTFSIVFWYKTTAGGFFVAKSADTGPSRGYGVGVHTGGTIKWEMTSSWASNVNFVHTTATGLNDGSWHHCAVTWDGNAIGGAGGMHIYIDGEDEPLTTVYSSLSATMVTTNSFWVGGRDATDHQYYSGSLDEVAVYNSELTETAVKWIFNAGNANDLKHSKAPSGLVSWWRMGELYVPSTVPDQQSSNDITLVNSPTPQTDVIAGTDVGLYPTAAPATYGFESESVVGIPGQQVELDYSTVLPGGGVVGPTTYYKMRAQDDGVPSPGYVTWVVTGDPDFAGTGFSGGDPTPVGSMVPGSAVVVSTWQE